MAYLQYFFQLHFVLHYDDIGIAFFQTMQASFGRIGSVNAGLNTAARINKMKDEMWFIILISFPSY